MEKKDVKWGDVPLERQAVLKDAFNDFRSRMPGANAQEVAKAASTLNRHDVQMIADIMKVLNGANGRMLSLFGRSWRGEFRERVSFYSQNIEKLSTMKITSSKSGKIIVRENNAKRKGNT